MILIQSIFITPHQAAAFNGRKTKTRRSLYFLVDVSIFILLIQRFIIKTYSIIISDPKRNLYE